MTTAMDWVKQSTPRLKELVAELEAEVTALSVELEQKQLILTRLRDLIALDEAPQKQNEPHEPRRAVYRYSISNAIDEVLMASDGPMSAPAIHEAIKDYEVFQDVTDLVKSIWNALARGCRINRYKKEGRGLYSKI